MRRFACLVLAAGLGCGATPDPAPTPPPAPEAAADRFHQSFDDATAPTTPDAAEFPPEKTLAGKSTAAVVADVRAAWDGIRFDGPDGKLATPRVTVRTAAGDFEVTLDPAAAPNHVRNFLALAKVGYYDGLVFERVVRQESVATDGSRTRFEFVTAGCPAGDGGRGHGHVGYFLKPEFGDRPHAEGTVGFWREDDDTSAGTRFYIMLGPCPAMDGKYTVIGKVSLGLEVVRAIAAAPVLEPDLERPAAPMLIRGIDRQP